MKQLIRTLTLALLFLVNHPLKAQEICLVSADPETGTNYIIYWEQFDDISNIDSVYIYRRQGVESIFSKVGAVNVSLDDPTFFLDQSANTIDTTKYAIATLDNLGNVSQFSPWHQAVVYDYSPNGNGFWMWTPYKKEDQIDESYIGGYACLLDMDGTGTYTTIGQVPNDQLYWTDVNFLSHADGYFVIEAELPACQIVERAEINTSRSNIKQQITNAEAGINENYLQGVTFEVSPNPTVDQLTVQVSESISNAKMCITNAKGEILLNETLSGNQIVLNTNEWAPGVYFVNIYNKGVVSTKKFIKN